MFLRSGLRNRQMLVVCDIVHTYSFLQLISKLVQACPTGLKRIWRGGGWGGEELSDLIRELLGFGIRSLRRGGFRLYGVKLKKSKKIIIFLDFAAFEVEMGD